jgi:hypothetical protein
MPKAATQATIVERGWHAILSCQILHKTTPVEVRTSQESRNVAASTSDQRSHSSIQM